MLPGPDEADPGCHVLHKKRRARASTLNRNFDLPRIQTTADVLETPLKGSTSANAHGTLAQGLMQDSLVCVFDS